MNEQLIKIGLESGMLNYVDNETPRHYFLSGHADEQDLEKFARLIVRDCIAMADDFECDVNQRGLVDRMKQHFGVKE
jgi:hypothetical protein